MNRWPSRLTPILCALGVFTSSHGLADGGDGAKVVVQVGEAKVTKGELERRLAEIPRPQLVRLGRTSAEIKNTYIKRVVVPELLLSEEARARKLDEDPALRLQIRDVYRRAILNAIQTRVVSGKVISDKEVEGYYQANMAKFQRPQRIAIWRLRVKTEKEAKALLKKVSEAGAEKRRKVWKKLVREHSTDKATHQRGGDLGFIAADGSSHMPTVKVDAALYKAANKLKNGEISPAPVKEGKEFAILWRKGFRRAQITPLGVASKSIRKVLARGKLAGELKKLMLRLRKEQVTELAAHRVDLLRVTKEAAIEPYVKSNKVTKARGLARPKPGTLR